MKTAKHGGDLEARIVVNNNTTNLIDSRDVCVPVVKIASGIGRGFLNRLPYYLANESRCVARQSA